MITENWERWEPLPDLAKKYAVEKIVENHEGLSIILTDDDNYANKILLQINGAAFAYRVSYEGFRVDLFGELVEKYGDKFHSTWTFFKVNNSEYLKCFDQQSCTITSRLELQHFCLIAMESVVDIAVYNEPKITLL